MALTSLPASETTVSYTFRASRLSRTGFAQREATQGPPRERAQKLLLLVVAAHSLQQIRVEAIVDGDDGPGAPASSRDLLDRHGHSQTVLTGAPIFLRHVNGQQSELAQLLYLEFVHDYLNFYNNLVSLVSSEICVLCPIERRSVSVRFPQNFDKFFAGPGARRTVCVN
jgi:hypothetical protein